MRKRRDRKTDKRPWLVGRLNARTKVSKIKVVRSNPRKSTKPRSNLVGGIIVAMLVVGLLWMPFTSIACLPQDEEGKCKNVELYASILDSTKTIFDHFSPLLNEGRLEEVLGASGYVESVNIDRTWYNALRVRIVERSAEAVWQLKEDNKVQYLLDMNGVVMSQATASSGNLADLLLVKDKVALEPSVGEPLVEQKVIQYAQRISTENLLPGYQITSVTINDSPREFTVRFRSTDGTKTMFNVNFSTNRLLERQILDLELSLQYFKEKGRSIKYIDLRLESSTPYR